MSKAKHRLRPSKKVVVLTRHLRHQIRKKMRKAGAAA